MKIKPASVIYWKGSYLTENKEVFHYANFGIDFGIDRVGIRMTLCFRH